MSRSKKSRKPGSGSIGAVKEDKPKFVEPTPKRPKKHNGNKAGNRQQEAKLNQDQKNNSPANRDPRIGNKTPIVLVKKPVKAEKKTPITKVKSTPISAIRMVEPAVKLDQSLNLEEELIAIEEDSYLQSILAKQDDDITLTEKEVNYFNEKMERHQELRELLGLDDEDDEDDEPSIRTNSEDDLWDKLDKNDLSDY